MSASDNLHKVPMKVWKRWTPRQRKVFNEVYDTMLCNQELFRHPDAAAIPMTQWTTTAWNAAWIAAGAVKGEGMPDGHTVLDDNEAGTVEREHEVRRSSTPRQAALLCGAPEKLQ